MPMRKRYSIGFRKYVVGRIIAGEVALDVARELHIAPGSVYCWISLYRKKLEALESLKPKKIYSMKWVNLS